MSTEYNTENYLYEIDKIIRDYMDNGGRKIDFRSMNKLRSNNFCPDDLKFFYNEIKDKIISNDFDDKSFESLVEQACIRKQIQNF